MFITITENLKLNIIKILFLVCYIIRNFILRHFCHIKMISEVNLIQLDVPLAVHVLIMMFKCVFEKEADSSDQMKITAPMRLKFYKVQNIIFAKKV